MTGTTFARTTLAGSAAIGVLAYLATGNPLVAALALWLGSGLVGGLTVLGGAAWEALAHAQSTRGWPANVCQHGTPREDYCPACRVQV